MEVLLRVLTPLVDGETLPAALPHAVATLDVTERPGGPERGPTVLTLPTGCLVTELWVLTAVTFIDLTELFITHT